MPNKFSRVFVTGGAGYIGSRAGPAAARARLQGDELRYFLLRRQFPAEEQSESAGHPAATSATPRSSRKRSPATTPLSASPAFPTMRASSSTKISRPSVNLDAFEPMVLAAKKAGVKRFVFASSSSVYGVSDQPNVTEDHPLVPLTLYNKYKGMCEPLLLKHTDEGFRRRGVSAGDGVRLRAAAALRSQRQYPDQSRHQ